MSDDEKEPAGYAMVSLEESTAVADEINKLFEGKNFHTCVSALMQMVSYVTTPNGDVYYKVGEFMEGVEVHRRLQAGEVEPMVGKSRAMKIDGTER